MFLDSSNQITMKTAAKNQKVQPVTASNTAKRNEWDVTYFFCPLINFHVAVKKTQGQNNVFIFWSNKVGLEIFHVKFDWIEFFNNWKSV